MKMNIQSVAIDGSIIAGRGEMGRPATGASTIRPSNATGDPGMPKFNANLSMMFNEVDFMERFAVAAKAGFKGVEFLFPYSYDKNQLADVARKNRLEIVLFNMPPGDWNAGDRGLACDPGRVSDFQEGVGKAI